MQSSMADARHVENGDLLDAADGGLGKREAGECTERGEDGAFDEELVQQLTQGCAQRGAGSEFVTATRVAGEQQIREVGAGDQQQQATCGERGEKRGARAGAGDEIGEAA